MEEKETKTVTMPLSEYRRMEEDAAMLKTKAGVETLKELERKSTSLKVELYELKTILRMREQRIAELKEELQKYKQRKWWQFWK